MKRAFLILCFGYLLLALGGCTGVNLSKRAVELRQAGQSVEAADTAIQRLRQKPKDEKTRQLLREIAQPAHDQLAKAAEASESGGGHDDALRQYSRLNKFVSDLQSVGVTVTTVDIGAKENQIKQKAAAEDYAKAEKAFGAGDYQSAIAAYEHTRQYVNDYKDSTGKVAESHYRIGELRFTAKSFAEAVNAYRQAAHVSPGYKDTKEKITESFYQQGLTAFGRQQWREAYAFLDDCLRETPGYKDAASKLSEAEQKSIVRIAVLPLKDSTGISPGGISVSDQIFDEMISALSQKKSRFLRIVDRANLGSLIAEYGLANETFTDRKSTPQQRLQGVDYVITGKITQISKENPEPKVNSREEAIAVYLYKVLQDGRAVDAGEGQATVTYQQVEMMCKVQISGSIQIVQVSSGVIIHTEPFSIERSDNTTFAQNVRCDIPKGASLSDVHVIPATIDEVVKKSAVYQNGLINARQSIRSLADLTKDTCSPLAQSFALVVLKKLDASPTM